MRRPELAVARQPRIEFEERLGPDAVQPALSIGASLDQSRVPEHPEVLRHGRLAQPQMCHQLSHGSFALAQQIQDRLPSRLGQNLECRRRSHTLSMLEQLYICQGIKGSARDAGGIAQRRGCRLFYRRPRSFRPPQRLVNASASSHMTGHDQPIKPNAPRRLQRPKTANRAPPVGVRERSKPSRRRDEDNREEVVYGREAR